MAEPYDMQCFCALCDERDPRRDFDEGEGADSIRGRMVRQHRPGAFNWVCQLHARMLIEWLDASGADWGFILAEARRVLNEIPFGQAEEEADGV